MFNHVLNSINESFTIAFADKVRRLQAQGIPIIGLQTGDPDFDTHPAIIKSAHQAMQAGETHYSNSRGLLELRQAIAHTLKNRYQVDYDPNSEILVTHGAVHAYHCALHAILNDGDEVLIADPSWQTHANMVRLLGGVPIRIATRAEDEFVPRISEFEAALTNKTRIILINYPNNPTGTIPNLSFFEQLNDFAIANKLIVVSDEVYDRIVYDENVHHCFASLPNAKDHTITINSFSKSYAMTGWRIGYVAASDKIIEQILKISQHTITNIAAFLQRGAITALTNPEVEQAVESMVAAYSRRRKLVMSLSDSMSDFIQIKPPAGAFYFFMDTRQIGIPSMQLSQRLLDEAQVALVPGSVYGDWGKGYLRMTIAASDEQISEGLNALNSWLNKTLR